MYKGNVELHWTSYVKCSSPPNVLSKRHQLYRSIEARKIFKMNMKCTNDSLDWKKLCSKKVIPLFLNLRIITNMLVLNTDLEIIIGYQFSVFLPNQIWRGLELFDAILRGPTFLFLSIDEDTKSFLTFLCLMVHLQYTKCGRVSEYEDTLWLMNQILLAIYF